MGNKAYHQRRGIIDLKELILFILRKWRILILVGVIGMSVSLLMPEKRFEDLNVEELHLKEIEQYAYFQQLYEDLLTKRVESVYVRMDPESVYTGNRLYDIRMPESDLEQIGELYNAVLKEEGIYAELAQVSGLDCSEAAVREMVWVSFTQYVAGQQEMFSENRECDVRVSVGVTAPSEAACSRMLALLNERIQAVNTLVMQEYPDVTVELMSEVCKEGFDIGVVNKRDESVMLLAGCLDMIAEIEKRLTEDDLLYYSVVYVNGGEDVDRGSGALRKGIVAGVFLAAVMVMWYGVMFLLNGRIKTPDELRDRYGLHQLALLELKKKKKTFFIDRLLENRYDYNTDEYMTSAVYAMGCGHLLICGDLKNSAVKEKMNLFAQNDSIVICDRLAVDEKAQLLVKEADGVVLYVQLWKTKHAEMLRELEIANHINARILGVVVID